MSASIPISTEAAAAAALLPERYSVTQSVGSKPSDGALAESERDYDFTEQRATRSRLAKVEKTATVPVRKRRQKNFFYTVRQPSPTAELSFSPHLHCDVCQQTTLVNYNEREVCTCVSMSECVGLEAVQFCQHVVDLIQLGRRSCEC